MKKAVIECLSKINQMLKSEHNELVNEANSLYGSLSITEAGKNSNLERERQIKILRNQIDFINTQLTALGKKDAAAADIIQFLSDVAERSTLLSFLKKKNIVDEFETLLKRVNEQLQEKINASTVEELNELKKQLDDNIDLFARLFNGSSAYDAFNENYNILYEKTVKSKLDKLKRTLSDLLSDAYKQLMQQIIKLKKAQILLQQQLDTNAQGLSATKFSHYKAEKTSGNCALDKGYPRCRCTGVCGEMIEKKAVFVADEDARNAAKERQSQLKEQITQNDAALLKLRESEDYQSSKPYALLISKINRIHKTEDFVKKCQMVKEILLILPYMPYIERPAYNPASNQYFSDIKAILARKKPSFATYTLPPAKETRSVLMPTEEIKELSVPSSVIASADIQTTDNRVTVANNRYASCIVYTTKPFFTPNFGASSTIRNT